MRTLARTFLLSAMLAWLPATAQVNDDCANATTITVGATCLSTSYSSIGATDDGTTIAPNPTCGGYSGGDVWFNFAVPTSGNFRIEMTSVGGNSQWALYSGTCGSFTQIKCASNGDDLNSNFSNPALAGQTLYLRSFAFVSSAGINFDLCIWEIVPPANDNCANATSLTIGSSCITSSYTTIYSTSEDASVAPNPNCGGYQEGDVWFNFVVPASGIFRIDMTSAGNNSQWALYSGNCGSFNQIKCASAGDDLRSNFRDLALAGQTLYLRAFTFVSSQGIDFDLCVWEITPPANDNCSNATTLIVGNSCTPATYTSINSTAEDVSMAANPSCGLYQEGDVWFSFLVPASGNFRIESTNGNGDQWALYTGSCGNFTQIKCASNGDDLRSNFSDPLLAGQTLYLRLWAFNSSQGTDFDLCIWEITPPNNDNCANATTLTVGSSCTLDPYSSINSTAEDASMAANPSCGLYQEGDVWFNFVVPASGNFRIEMTNGNGDQWALYSGSCGNFTQIKCSSNGDDLRSNFSDPAIAGQTLYLRSWVFNSSQGTNFDLCVWEITPPANNDCANATNLILNDSCVTITASSQFTTAQDVSVAQDPSCGLYQGGDVWFTFIAPASGQFSIDIANITSGNRLAMYTGTCGNFIEIACDNSTQFAFNDPSLGGQVIHIRGYMFNSQQGGDFELCVRNTTIAPNDNCADAIVLPVDNTCNLQLFDSFNTTEEVGMAPNPSCGVYQGADVWFAFVVPATGQVQINKNNVSGGAFYYTLYTGTCGSFTEIYCDNDAQYLLNDITLVGQTVYMRMYRFNSNFGGEFELCLIGGDCTGTIGGTAVPGSTCDDNNVCTVNDVYDSSCNCSGTFQDSDNDGICDANDQCPGGPEPGTGCDDSDVCTINDVIQSDCSCAGTFQDTDNDGTCDANDVCPGSPEPGAACDDSDPNTANDIVQADCTCDGTPTGGENTPLACADGIDNDGDGFIDCDDPQCQALNNGLGCATCFNDGLSFADVVLEYLNTCPGNTATDSSQALGVPNHTTVAAQNFVSLGQGGSISLQFTNNTLTNSGTSDADLYVFEVGPIVEASTLELRPLDVATENQLIAAGLLDADADGFYEFGGIGGSTASLDIDALVPGAASGSLFFDAVQIVDDPGSCSGSTPGADIDGVCALSSLDCVVGASCDDNDPCTVNDMYLGNCTCAGTFQDADNDGICDANDIEGIASSCVDGIDNDGDGLIDCDDPECQAYLGGLQACTTCFGDALSFADAADGYINTCPNNQATDPSASLGAPDYVPGGDTSFVSLGDGGQLNLYFTDNTLNNSGNSDADLFVFEEGPLVEGSALELRPVGSFTETQLILAGLADLDGDGFYEFDTIQGSTAAVDIDQVVPGQNAGTLFFDAIQIVDLPSACGTSTPGADIDAVCAISSVPCAVGISCDDADPLTFGDVVQSDCSCAGIVCIPNDPCDDGNACTTGETFQSDCSCAGGTPVDPDDNDPCTLDSCDPVTGVSNVFQDADTDGVCDSNDLCANTPGGEGVNTDGCSCSQVTVDDGDPCTLDECTDGVVTNTFQDADNDGVCDANDNCPNVPGQIGDLCDDMDPSTSGDQLQADCTCAGVSNCTPGTPCDDGNACTTGELFQADCTCSGGTPVVCDDGDPCTTDSCDPINGCVFTFDDADNDGVCDATDLCANTPNGEGVNTDGCSCSQVVVDDGDPCTLDECTDGVVTNTFQDADNDGTCDANDVCPAGPEPGTACDDNDPATSGDVILGDCSCAGVANCTPGAPCDDLNACTTGETFQLDCTCAGGTPVDPDDGNPCTMDSCDPISGIVNTPIIGGCDDGNACTINDTCQPDGSCSGTPVDPDDNDPCTLDSCDPVTGVSNVFQDADNDGTCDANDVCPTGPEPGTPCDDNDPSTSGDVIQANCSCAGTTAGACSEDITLIINTDGSGSQTTWEIQDMLSTLVQSGGPYASNSTITETFCLPTSVGNHYGLTILDSFGDGMCCANGTGSWELHDSNGQTIIKDNGEFTTRSPSATPANSGYVNGHEFDLPLGPAEPLASECNVFSNSLLNKVYCNTVAGASTYQFEFLDPNAGFTRRIAVPRNWVRFSEMQSVPLQPGITYFCRVKADVGNDGLFNDAFGPGCEMGLDANQVPGCTALIDNVALPTHSCNVIKQFGVGNKIWAQPVVGASAYKFSFQNPNEGFLRNITFPNYVCVLNWVTLPLTVGTYDVTVEVLVNGIWSGFCGNTCQLTIAQPASSLQGQASITSDPQLMIFPNPNSGDQLQIVLSQLTGEQQQLQVELFDLYGKLVHSSNFSSSSSKFQAQLNLDATLIPGAYMMRVQANGHQILQTLIVE